MRDHGCLVDLTDEGWVLGLQYLHDVVEALHVLHQLVLAYLEAVCHVLVDHLGVAELHGQRELVEGLVLEHLQEPHGARAIRIHYHYHFVGVLHGDGIVDQLDEHGQELLEVDCQIELLLQIEEEPLVAPIVRK